MANDLGQVIDPFEQATNAAAPQEAPAPKAGALSAVVDPFAEHDAPGAPAPQPAMKGEAASVDQFAGESPATALPENPDSGLTKVTSRIATAFGNTKGTVEGLKGTGRYEDVTYQPGKGVLLKKGGKWYQYDPSMGQADPWDLTEKIADVAGFTAGALAPAVATAASTAVAGPVAGALLGGAGGAVVNQNLGRLFGTYSATPEEELRDMAWDSVLNLAGVTAAKGLGVAGKGLYDKMVARPTGRVVLDALKTVGEAAAAPVKAVTKTLLKMTGANAAAVETLVDQPTAVTEKISKHLWRDGNLSKPSSAIRQQLAEDTMTTAGNYLEQTPKFLFDRFDRMEKDLLADPAISRFKANTRGPIQMLMDSLHASGWIEPATPKINGIKGFSQQVTREVTDTAAASSAKSGAAAGLRTAEGDVAAGARAAVEDSSMLQRKVKDSVTQRYIYDKTPGKFGYRVKGFDELVDQLAGQGTSTNPLIMKTAVRRLGEFVDQANQLLKSSESPGAAQAAEVLRVRRGLDKFFYAATDSNPELKKTLMAPWRAARESLASSFDVPGTQLGSKYARMNDFFTQNYEFVQDAAKIARTGMKGSNLASVQSFMNRVYEGNDPAAKAVFERVMKIGGDLGAATRNKIMVNNAADQFVKAFPHMEVGTAQKAFSTTVRGAAIGSAAYMSTPLGVGALAAASSPRLSAAAVGTAAKTVGSAAGAGAAAKYLPYVKQFRDSIALMGRKEKRAALADTTLIPGMAAAAEEAAKNEDQVRERLLQEGGAK